jgi:hypothetical protein
VQSGWRNVSRLLLPDSARPEAPQATLSLSWGNDSGNVVLVMQCGAVVTQVMMPPTLAIQLGEGLIGSANQVLDLQRKATSLTVVN